jgi:hypothetical protein
VTLAATFELIDVIELAIVFGIAFGVVAVFAVLYLRGQRKRESTSE